MTLFFPDFGISETTKLEQGRSDLFVTAVFVKFVGHFSEWDKETQNVILLIMRFSCT